MIDIPAMGYSDLANTDGYFQHGDLPIFKLMKQGTGKIILLDGDIPLWQDNGLFQLSSLSEVVLVPNKLSFVNAYPNPFNPITTIGFGMPNEMKLSIEIFDVEGRRVESLFNGIKSSGYHSVDWDATYHTSGLYFVKIIADNHISTQKLMLIK